MTVTPNGLKHAKYPCLKYTVYNIKIWNAIKSKIKTIKDSIDEVTENLNNYKGNKINPIMKKKLWRKLPIN